MFSIKELVKVRSTLLIPVVTGTTKLAERLNELGKQVTSRLADPEAAAKYYQEHWAAQIGYPAVEAMIGQPTAILATFDKLVDELQKTGCAQYLVDVTPASGNVSKTGAAIELQDLAGSAKIIVEAVQ
jgi:hypothetical protein